MRIQGKCVECRSCREYPMYKQELQPLRYKLLSARVPGEGTGFCLLEVIITVQFHSNQELGDFDKECEDCGELKGEKEWRECVNLLLLSWFLEKGNLLWGLIFAAVLFQGDWIITSFDLGRIQGIIFSFTFRTVKQPQTCLGSIWTSLQWRNVANYSVGSPKTDGIFLSVGQCGCDSEMTTGFQVFLQCTGLGDSLMICQKHEYLKALPTW